MDDLEASRDAVSVDGAPRRTDREDCGCCCVDDLDARWGDVLAVLSRRAPELYRLSLESAEALVSGLPCVSDDISDTDKIG